MRGPTMLLFEDIHWADESLLDLLETLRVTRPRRAGPVRRARAAGAPRRAAGLGRRPPGVHGAPARSAQRRRRARSSPSSSSPARVDARACREGVAEMAEGNPLFIEELAASIAEQTVDGSTSCPTSVRAIIAARLDSLPAAERSRPRGRVGRRGASSGGARSRDGAARGPRRQCLGSLEARGLIRREAVSRIKGDQQFAFKHALIHDVAYQTPPAGGPTRTARGCRPLPRGSDGGRPVTRGARAPLARGGRERSGGRRSSSPPPSRPGAGGPRTRASRSTAGARARRRGRAATTHDPAQAAVHGCRPSSTSPRTTSVARPTASRLRSGRR